MRWLANMLASLLFPCMHEWELVAWHFDEDSGKHLRLSECLHCGAAKMYDV